jgi:hypothetical protein
MTTSSFLRLIPGPWEAPLFDGRFRVVALEVFGDRFVLYWHVFPMPTTDRPAANALADQRGATTGRGDVEPSDERSQWQARVLTAKMEVTDDVGTRFGGTVGGGGGSADEWWGARVFVPALNPAAKMLTVRFHGEEIALPLT